MKKGYISEGLPKRSVRKLAEGEAIPSIPTYIELIAAIIIQRYIEAGDRLLRHLRKL